MFRSTPENDMMAFIDDDPTTDSDRYDECRGPSPPPPPHPPHHQNGWGSPPASQHQEARKAVTPNLNNNINNNNNSGVVVNGELEPLFKVSLRLASSIVFSFSLSARRRRWTRISAQIGPQSTTAYSRLAQTTGTRVSDVSLQLRQPPQTRGTHKSSTLWFNVAVLTARITAL